MEIFYKISSLIRFGLRVFLGFSWVSAILYERDLINDPITDVTLGVPVEVVRGNVSHLEVVRPLLPTSWLSSYEQRLRDGKIWVLAFVYGKPAYTSWVSFVDEFESVTGTIMQLAPNEAYIYNSFTIPEFRGLGLHTMMSMQQLRIAKEEGANYVLGIVLKENAPARHVWTKLGFRKREEILTLRFLRWQVVHRFHR